MVLVGFNQIRVFMAIDGKTQLSPILARYGISMVWSLSAIPVAGALAMAQTILQILIDLFGKKEVDIKGSVILYNP